MFQPMRRLGKLLMIVSVVFLMAALYTFFFFNTVEFASTTEQQGREIGKERARDQLAQHLERSTQYPFWGGPQIPSPNMYIWSYRWLSPPLAIIGLILFLTGLLIGYHDDISELF